MACLTVSADLTRDASHPAEIMVFPPGGDGVLCDKLQVYLDCRSRRVDPPASLDEAWDDSYTAYTPRIRTFLGRCGLPEADPPGRLEGGRRPLAQSRLRSLTRPTLDLDHDGGPEPGGGLDPAPPASLDGADRGCGRSHGLASRSGRGVRESLDARPSAKYAHRTLGAGLGAEFPGALSAPHRRSDEHEVANTLGLTPEQVRFRLHRMKQKFRDLLERSVTGPLS